MIRKFGAYHQLLNSYLRSLTGAERLYSAAHYNQSHTMLLSLWMQRPIRGVQMSYSWNVSVFFTPRWLNTSFWRILLWLSTEAVAFFHAPCPLLFFPPACSLVSYCNTWETLSALLLKTSKLKNHGFDQLVSQRNWHHLLDEKHRFGGA